MWDSGNVIVSHNFVCIGNFLHGYLEHDKSVVEGMKRRLLFVKHGAILFSSQDSLFSRLTMVRFCDPMAQD